MARILYLDDEESLVFLMSRMLKVLGHECSGFTLADQALAAFGANPGEFDLVLTDLSMPGTDGIDFARQILALRREARVAVLTGHADPKEIETARAAGVLDVTAKPGTLEQMEKVVNGLLAQSPAR